MEAAAGGRSCAVRFLESTWEGSPSRYSFPFLPSMKFFVCSGPSFSYDPGHSPSSVRLSGFSASFASLSCVRRFPAPQRCAHLAFPLRGGFLYHGATDCGAGWRRQTIASFAVQDLMPCKHDGTAAAWLRGSPAGCAGFVMNARAQDG